MSTRMRSAKAGSCSIVRSTPSATMSRSWGSPSRASDTSPYTSRSTDPPATKSPAGCSWTRTQSCRRAQRTRPASCTAWMAPAPVAADDQTGRVGGRPVELARVSGRAGVDPTATTARIDSRPARATSEATMTGRSRRRGPHEHGERRLEQAVAVPKAAGIGGEGPRRHLDDKHADRHDEPRQADGRGHDRGQHRQRSAGRVIRRARAWHRGGGSVSPALDDDPALRA
jgi:hypothetical protein